MLCPYCQLGSYFGTCTCSVSNGVCPFVRRCNFERKWLPLNSMDGCRLRTKQERVKNMSASGYHVRFESKGKLYVEYNGRVIKIANPFDYVPEAIELVRVENELYIKGFEPRIEKEEKEIKDEHSEIREEVSGSEEELADKAQETTEEEPVVDFDWTKPEEEEKPKKKKGGSRKKKKDK